MQLFMLKVAFYIVWGIIKGLFSVWFPAKSPVQEVEHEVQVAHKVQDSVERGSGSDAIKQLHSEWERK